MIIKKKKKKKKTSFREVNPTLLLARLSLGAEEGSFEEIQLQGGGRAVAEKYPEWTVLVGVMFTDMLMFCSFFSTLG